MGDKFAGWTDEQVRLFALTGEEPPEGAKPAGTNPNTNKPFTTREVLTDMVGGGAEDNTQGMSGFDLFRAGMGSIPAKLGRGVSDLATMATLPSDPQTRQAILDKMNAERESQSKIDSSLFKNPEAVGGMLAGEGAVAAAAPARVPAQVASQAAMGFLNPPTSGPSGGWSETANRGRQALERGSATAAVGVPMQMAGRGIAAARGQYTPEGELAMRLNDQAQRIGVNPTIRDLDPSSELAGFEGQLFGRAKEVESQVKAFNTAAQDTKAVPSASGASTTDRVLEGEKVRQAVVDGTNNLRTAGSKLWSDLDGYIGANQIQPVTPDLSFKKIESILQNYTPQNKAGTFLFDDNSVISRIAYYDSESAKKLVAMGRAPPQAVKFGAPFQDLHEIQSAVGKALGKAQRDASAPNAGEDALKAYRELRELYSTMSQDVDNWMSTVAAKSGSDELTKLATTAKSFWRDVVVPGTGGRLPAKAAKGTWRQNRQAYSEPRELYGDITKSQTQMDELLPYMTKEQQDLLGTFNGMSDMRKSLLSGQAHPATTGAGMLTNVGGMMIGSPLQLMKGALSHTPILKDLVGSNAGKRAYFAKNALENTGLGRVSNALSAKPRWDLQEWERGVMGEKR